jgi:hypothetical protein
MIKFKKIIAQLTCVGLSFCAASPFASYKTSSDYTLNQVSQGKLATAMAAESTMDPLYNLEYGQLQRLQSHYSLSNYYFSLVQESLAAWVLNWNSSLGGKLSAEGLALLINDNLQVYQLRAYEKTFLATYSALNHLNLNDWEHARVEIKRMYQFEEAIANYNQALYANYQIEAQALKHNQAQDYLAQQIMQEYNFSDINSPQVLALKNSYQNAFSHYLAGFVFEALNEPSLARPGYIKAGQLSPRNQLIQSSLKQLDLQHRPNQGSTELLVIEEVGHAPQIQSRAVHIPLQFKLGSQQGNCINMVNLFFPQLVITNKNSAVYQFNLDSQQVKPSTLVDLKLMASRALVDDLPHLIARNVAAAARNIIASQGACSAGGNLGLLLSLGSSLGGALLDHVDERSWTLLPQYINVARVRLPYGRHKIQLKLAGVVQQQEIYLNQAYQVISLRIIDSQVYFNLPAN